MTLSNRLLRLLPAVLMGLPAPALAQEREPAASEADQAAQGDHFGGTEIVVTGRELDMSERTVTRQARTISRESDLRHTPLATFADRACPGVVGLQRDYAEVVVTRLRWLAEDLGIPLHPEGDCRANIILVFTSDGRADVRELERKTRLVSESLGNRERRELLEGEGPVRVFNVVEDRMRNGQRIPRRQNLVQIPVGSQEGGQSLIGGGIRRVITSSIVYFDHDAIEGTTLHQLADYAAMRVFAQTRDAEGEKAPDSILSLFDRNTVPPKGLTAFDRAFLTTLYESYPYTPGQGNLQRVAQVLREQMEREE
jgi:hypothetical protein